MIKPPSSLPPRIEEETLGRALAHAFAGDPERRLRPEEARKVRLLPGLLDEAIRLLPKGRHAAPALVIDAAAGRGPVTLGLAVALGDRPTRFHAIERDASRLAALEAGFLRAAPPGHLLSVGAGDVGDPTLWPRAARLVVAVHACGDASDLVLRTAIETGARHVLLVPCCVTRTLPAAVRAERLADRLGYPRGQLRRRFRDVHTLGERALALEAAGYETEIVPICAESVSPYNLALRASLVGEPVRARRAREQLERLRAGSVSVTD
jgi:hypothetical protein